MSKIVELLFDIMKALYKIEKSKSITKARKLHELLARLQVKVKIKDTARRCTPSAFFFNTHIFFWGVTNH